MLVLFAMAALAAGCPREACAEEGPIRVTVVVVLATTENATVDPKLKELAAAKRVLIKK